MKKIKVLIVSSLLLAFVVIALNEPPIYNKTANEPPIYNQPANEPPIY